MRGEHIVLVDLMRDYLLGKLDDQSSAKLEERYFADRPFFLRIQAVEFSLIEDYLRGKLSESDRQRFERRYRVVPEMCRRLEEVRQHLGLPMPADLPPVFGFAWRPALAAVVMVVFGVGLWTYWHIRQEPRHDLAVVAPAVQLPVIQLRLIPGQQKGENAGGAQVVLPASPAILRLELEFPDHAAAFEGVATLYLAGDGERTVVWQSTQPVTSVRVAGGQSAIFELPTALLRRGDYIVDAGPVHGAPSSYVFHVLPVAR